MKAVIIAMARTIEEHHEYLTELDRQIGDADHGNNLMLGFRQAVARLSEQKDEAKPLIKYLGMTLVATVGGAAGPLYGMSFVRAAEAFGMSPTYSASEFKAFVTLFAKSIADLGKAEVGQKTMLDIWKPFALYLASAAFDRAAWQAKITELANATKDMQARKGRASYLGTRSIGVIDPGTASSALILTELVAGIS